MFVVFDKRDEKGCVCEKCNFFGESIFEKLIQQKERIHKLMKMVIFVAFMDSIFMICEFVSFKLTFYTNTPIFVSERKKGSRFVWNNFHLSSLQFFPKIYEKNWKKRQGKKNENDTLMIPPQVHLRRPCYDFSFL